MPLADGTGYQRPNVDPDLGTPLRMYLDNPSEGGLGKTYLPPRDALMVQKIGDRNADGTNSGVLAPVPEYPIPEYTRMGASVTAVPGIDGSSVIAGRTIHQDFGVHESSGKFDVTLPMVDLAFLMTLRAYSDLANPDLRWSPDDGVNEWRVLFQEGQSFVPEPEKGFPGLFKLVLKFRVVLKSV